MPQSLNATVAGLKAACDSIYTDQVGPDDSPVLVSYGPPGTYLPAAIVAVAQNVRQPITRPTAGTNRSREKEAEIDVVISVWASGAEEVQPIVCVKANDLAELLEAYFRVQGQETLGGGCREAWVSSISGPDPDVTVDAESGAVTGRVAESIVTVTARIRQ